MRSPPENMKLEGLIADTWDEDALTPEILILLEPYRTEIEQIADSFDPSTQSWRDYRPSVWLPVPIDTRCKVTGIWVEYKLAGRGTEAIDFWKQQAAPGHPHSEPVRYAISALFAASAHVEQPRWVLRDGEPDIDNPEGVDLRVADRFELADLVCAGIVAPSFREVNGHLVVRTVFPPRCPRYRFVAGVGIGVSLPNGGAIIEGPDAPWRLSRDRCRENLTISNAPLATLATEVTRRGAFVVFDVPMDLKDAAKFFAQTIVEAGLVDPNAACVRDAKEALADLRRMAGPGHPLSEPIDRAVSALAIIRAESKDQPVPTPNDGESIWEIVINDVQATYGETSARESLLADMRDRDRVGRARYGTPLQANNGRDAVRDAYEEALDGTVYSRQAYEESAARPEGSDQTLHVIYQDFVELAYRLRVTMNMRNR